MRAGGRSSKKLTAVARWELQWGSQYAFLKEVAAKTGFTPPALRDRPALQPRNRHLLEAFFALSAGRSYGEGGGLPLTTADIYAYTQLADIRDLDQRMRFLDVMRALDAVHLTEMLKKQTVLTKPK